VPLMGDEVGYPLDGRLYRTVKARARFACQKRYNRAVKSAVLNRIYFLLSMVGLFISGSLSVAKFFNVLIPCGLKNECAIVEAHPSSEWFNIPVAYIGLAAYIFFAIISVLRMHYRLPKNFVVGPFIVNLIGAAIHVGLAIYASSVINATCIWCLCSMATMVVMFFVSAMLAQAEGIEMNPRFDLIYATALAVVALGALGIYGNRIVNGEGVKRVSKKLEERISKSEMISSTTKIMGSPSAPITIVEFADLFCPACRNSFPKLKKIVLESNGKVRWVFHHMPLYRSQGHEFSWQAAELSEFAAEKGKFWPYVEAVYATPHGGVTSVDNLLEIVTQLGLDPEVANARLGKKEDPLFKAVYKDFLLANYLGVDITPTILVKVEGGDWQVAEAKNLEAMLSSRMFRDIINKK